MHLPSNPDPSPLDAPPVLSPAGGRTLLGHPPGLFLLFTVEMWERFSYYGMRALLVLYLIRRTAAEAGLAGAQEANPGRGWGKAEASTLYGWYTGLVYLTPILGGIIADKLIGTHRSMVIGGLLIMLGHIVLAISGMGDLGTNAVGMSTFIGGLALIVVGTGHFKPSVSVMVGQLYPEGDPRRDGAFTIFYMGINLGAFICVYTCGTLGEKVSWHWGFGCAAVGMALGLISYMMFRPMALRGIGLAPAAKERSAWGVSMMFVILGIVLSAIFGFLQHQGAWTKVMGFMTWSVAIGIAIVTTIASVWFIAVQRREDRKPVASIFLFMLFNAFFWVAFEQAGSSLNVFTEQNTDRHIGSFEVPATWFQSINAGFIFIMAPMFAGLWTWLDRRRKNPSQPMKIGLGLVFVGLGYLFMVWAAGVNKGSVLAPMWPLVALYFWHTVGELCLSPTGLSYVTKAAPVRFVSLLMGIWFVSSFIANLSGGLIAAQVEDIEKGVIKLPWHLGGQADFFLLFVVVSGGAGVLVMLFTPLLKKLMRNPND
jgi:POT family proton-dependent oligopeptide transporter